MGRFRKIKTADFAAAYSLLIIKVNLNFNLRRFEQYRLHYQ
jgi:hypothetical protein